MSASERYFDDCREFDRKQIKFSNIKKRWFKNHYVLYQSEGWFKHNCYVFHSSKLLDKNKRFDRYPGIWYGPFWNQEEANSFAKSVESTHTKFILG